MSTFTPRPAPKLTAKLVAGELLGRTIGAIINWQPNKMERYPLEFAVDGAGKWDVNGETCTCVALLTDDDPHELIGSPIVQAILAPQPATRMPPADEAALIGLCDDGTPGWSWCGRLHIGTEAGAQFTARVVAVKSDDCSCRPVVPYLRVYDTTVEED